MNRLHHHRLLSALLVGALVAWLSVAALPTAHVAESMPRSAAPVPAAATDSLYPAPQIDESAPVQEASPTF